MYSRCVRLPERPFQAGQGNHALGPNWLDDRPSRRDQDHRRAARSSVSCPRKPVSILLARLFAPSLGRLGAAQKEPPSEERRSARSIVNTKQLGNSGVQVPELALGTWQYQGGVPPLRVGIELGACFIDTAESYGTEVVVGQATRGIRDRIFLASKVSPRHFRYQDVIQAAERSLKQLNTDHLDLYQLHWPNYSVPVAETMAAMEKLVEMGNTRVIGVSNFTVA